MKLIVVLLCLLLFANCTKKPTYICGYVYDETKKPLAGIKLEDPKDRKVFTFTNKKGYFMINHITARNFLYLKVKDKIIDSVYFVRRHPERGISYVFVEGRSDTLFITK